MGFAVVQEMVRAHAPSSNGAWDEPAAIVRSSHDAIIGVTTAGVISSCNDAAAKLYGYAAADLIGSRVDRLIPARQLGYEMAILRRVAAGEAVEAYVSERVRCDGTVLAVALTVSPLADDSGVVRGTATIGRRIDEASTRDRFAGWLDGRRGDAKRRGSGDAHERLPDGPVHAGAHVRTEREALQAKLHQSQRLEVLGQLAGGVAHDFNNLLAVILNYAAFVDEELTAGPEADLVAAGRDVKQVQRAAERAAALTQQLLAFGRREIVRPEVLNLNDVVNDVQQLLDRTIGKDVVLHTRLAADLWPVMADAGQTEQILVNLAVNARDAMPGGGSLSIDTANIDVGSESVAAGSTLTAGRHVRLRIEDTGTGIPADVIEHVFEPFYTTKPDGTGTGLGLSTVYGIVAQAGATIDIHSQAGVGTTFTIMVPATDAQAVVAADEPAKQRAPEGETILVVEDEEALREVTERIFTTRGYQVLTAANGGDAVALAAQHDGDIHLLVTDVVMPNMLGKEVAESIRQLRPDVEVLYMSGYAQPVLASQGRLDPDVHLIEKPFSASSIVEKAGQVLNGHPRGFRADGSAGDPAAIEGTTQPEQQDRHDPGSP